jgi:thiamine phosphate synthase YjbQ (UPF0047 family)
MINENADPSVRTDFTTILNRLIPEGDPAYVHTDEGEDDMPAHVKVGVYRSKYFYSNHQWQDEPGYLAGDFSL